MVAPKNSSSPSLPKSGAISKGYNFASTWEQNAPLTEQQQSAIVALSHAVAERPFPPNLTQDGMPGQGHGLSVDTQDSVADNSAAIEAVLVNTNQFYKWFTDLEAAMKSETEEKYRHYVDTLMQRIQTCDGILRQVDDTLELFNELQYQHQAVATKTKTLHDACDRLLIEKQRLIEFTDALRSKLSYFDELENISTSFYSPSMNVGNREFLPLLKRLDECISYVESNPQYAESSVYLVKFRQLQSRALNAIRSHVQSVLKNASSQVHEAIRNIGGSKPSFSEGVEASVIYVRFKAAASESRISSRVNLGKLKAPASLLLLPSLISLLLELVDVLKVEVLGEQLCRRSESLAGLRPTFERILADVHERLTFRARTHIRDEIANYFPINEDLDYPAKLEQSPDSNEEAQTCFRLTVSRTKFLCNEEAQAGAVP